MSSEAPQSAIVWAHRKLTGESGTAIWTFGLSALLKLVSSMVLTRLLTPEDYGVMSMVVAILVTLELLSDLGFSLFILRHPHPEDAKVINTIWSVRLVRALANAVLLWFAAPWLARLFNAVGQEDLIRLTCLTVLLQGVESMGYLLALRQQRSSIAAKHELLCSAISTVFSIAWTQYVQQTAQGMVLSMVLSRALLCILSRTKYVPFHESPRWCWDKGTVAEMVVLAKSVVPASLCTLALQQIDRLTIARFLPLSKLGVYGIGQNIAGMGEGLAARLIGSVVVPRIAALIQTLPPKEAVLQIYANNNRPICIALGTPILIGSFAPFLISLMYDNRYAQAALVVQAVCMRSFLVQVTGIGSQILAIAGYNRVLSVPGALRALFITVAAWPAVSYGGFEGLLLLIAAEPFIAYLYIKNLQYKTKYFSAGIEVKTLILAALLWGACMAITQLGKITWL